MWFKNSKAASAPLCGRDLARLFGHDLKSEYDASGEDAAIEHIIHAHRLEGHSGTSLGIEPRALTSNRTPQLPNNDQELLSPAVLKLSSQSMEKAFILYDLEATCWRTSRPKRVEIIEVGAVKVNADLEIVSEYCAFVRPMVHPCHQQILHLPHLHSAIRH